METSKTTSSAVSTARSRRLPPVKRFIKLIGRITFIIMTRCAGLLRPWSINLLGSTLGSLFYVASKRYRNVALKNLRSVYGGEKSEEEIRGIAKDVFKHFTRGAFEFFRFLALDKKQISELIEMQGIEHVDTALAEGKGCVIITAHYGNWELLARKMVILGHTVSVIARDSDDPGMTGITNSIRESGGYSVYDRDQPIIGAFRCLKHNEILGILPDQNESHGIFVDFFGRPAATAVGPAVLALKSGAAVVPAFARRLPNGKYVGVIYPKIDFVASGDEDKDVRKLTALINKAIEVEIRSNPAQWLWLHDRWKLSPEASKSDSK